MIFVIHYCSFVRLKINKSLMGKCEQCIVREFSSLKALNKDELIKMC